MEYELRAYSDIKEFNIDARERFVQVMKERTATSYDSFWRVEKLMHVSVDAFVVLWSRPAPLRKH